MVLNFVDFQDSSNTEFFFQPFFFFFFYFFFIVSDYLSTPWKIRTSPEDNWTNRINFSGSGTPWDEEHYGVIDVHSVNLLSIGIYPKLFICI